MRCFCLVLLLVLGAAESSAAPEHPASSSSFRFSLQDQQNTILSKCVATVVHSGWLISAAHCLNNKVTQLFSHCPADKKGHGTGHVVSNLVFHAEFDLVLIQLETLPGCVTKSSIIAEVYPETAEITSMGIAPGLPTDPIAFETVQRDELTLVLLDTNACLGRGDSGYPLYLRINDQLKLVGILIGGTEECPSYQQVVRLDQQGRWISSVVGEAGCTPGPCLTVDDPTVVFCSIDPPGLNGLSNLSNKSRVTFASSNFQLPKIGGDSLPPLTLETTDKQMDFEADKTLSVKTIRPLQGDQHSRNRLEVQALYKAASGEQIDVRFRAAATDHPQVFRLDSRDAESYWSEGLNLRIKSRAHGTLLYAPCSLTQQRDRRFIFELDNALRVTATVRAAVGSYELGFYIGRVLHVRIETDAAEFEVADWTRLSYLGSTLNQGDLNAPGLVVRIESVDHGCGFVFDPSGWDTDQAVDGYLAYRLGCDGLLGERLTLLSADYPADYVFP